ncbi:MAG: metal ABC transporter permease [Candidatus Synoicihabitans palmerolidicus]|nr:metal ABC transporter permease [Candidatus Synoicihabitans palmerolidicus]
MNPGGAILGSLGRRRLVWALGLAICFAPTIQAASVQDIANTDWGEQLVRFFSFRDASLRYALVGSVLLGLSCGLLGSFIVVRRMALVGDALSHAVLPGVALGFLWNMSKDPWAIFVGAVVAGLAGTAMVSALTRTTRLKEDTALGLVLATFFAVGICLVTMIQRLPTGNKSGLDKFLFGQAAALGGDDVSLMAIVTLVAVTLVGLFYKELLATSFDPGFARSSGIPAEWVHHGLMLMLAASTVIALQAVGVVLVSAMLITPAATAYLLTDRMHRMLLLASGCGVLAGVTGAFFSFVGRGLPTGPLMVIGASTVFTCAYFMGPRHGVIARWWRHRQSAARTERENTLKALYHIWENGGFRDVGTTLADLAERRKETIDEALGRSRMLAGHGFATVDSNVVYFTPEGRQRAAEIVRNHRLWELYLTNSANIAPDHVHDDAERIEHVLGETVVRELERRLNYATVDPHGKSIPGPRDIHRDAAVRGGDGGVRNPEETS